jgi:hypothetical protein
MLQRAWHCAVQLQLLHDLLARAEHFRDARAEQEQLIRISDEARSVRDENYSGILGLEFGERPNQSRVAFAVEKFCWLVALLLLAWSL